MRWILFATTILLLSGCASAPETDSHPTLPATDEAVAPDQALDPRPRGGSVPLLPIPATEHADHDDDPLPEIELLGFESFGQDALIQFNASDPEGDFLGWGVDFTSDGVVDIRGTNWPAAVPITGVSEGFHVASVLVEDGHHIVWVEVGYQTLGSTEPMRFSDFELDACLPVGKGSTCAFGAKASHFIAIRDHAPALDAVLTWDMFGLDMDLRLFTLEGALLAESATSDCAVGAGAACDAPSEEIQAEVEPGIYRLEVEVYQALDSEYQLQVQTGKDVNQLVANRAET